MIKTTKERLAVIETQLEDTRGDIKSLSNKIDTMTGYVEQNIRSLEQSKVGKTELNLFKKQVDKCVSDQNIEISQIKKGNFNLLAKVTGTIISISLIIIGFLIKFILTTKVF